MASNNNNRKKYFHIDSGTSSDVIFAILDDVMSDEEEDIDNLMNDSDTEFIADENVDLSTNNCAEVSLLTPTANVHIVESDADSSTEPKNKNKKQKLAKPDAIKWSRKKTVNVRQACNLHAESLHEFPENYTPLEVFQKVCIYFNNIYTGLQPS